MSDQERTGKLFLQFLFGLYIVMEVTLIAVSTSIQGSEELITGGIRLTLTLGLMYAALRGQRWAKWVFVALASATVLVGGFFFLERPDFLTLGTILYCLLMLYALLISEPVRAYLRSRRLALQNGQPDDGANNDQPDND